MKGFGEGAAASKDRAGERLEQRHRGLGSHASKTFLFEASGSLTNRLRSTGKLTLPSRQAQEAGSAAAATASVLVGVLSGYVRNVNIAAYDQPLYALKAVFRRCEPENLHVDKAASEKEIFSERQFELPS